MIERAHGLILRLRPFTETSLVVQWLTPGFGRISTIAKGARRPKSPFRGKLDLFYEADLSFNRSRRSELHTLSELILTETHPILRQNLDCLRQASYCAALVEQTTESDTPLPAIFSLLHEFLGHLPNQPPQPRNIYAFELKLLDELGLGPDPSSNPLSAETKELVRALSVLDWSDIAALKTTAAAAKQLKQFLHGFLIFHLGKIPKGRI